MRKFFLKFKKNERDKLTRQKELDKKLIYSLSKSKIPNYKQFKYLSSYLSKGEIKIVRLCLLVIFCSSIFWVGFFVKTHLQIMPKVGGEYIEGLVGSPKYINPLYSSAGDVDNDIANLVFSSLYKRGENGELVNDLARESSVGEDLKSYTIKIRTDAKWHNGEKLTVDDIIFTFNIIKDPLYASPLRSGFEGVTIERIDDETIRFNLSEPYAAFSELLTFGVIPQDLWFPIPPEAANLAELNLKPIGSGPYQFDSLKKDKKTGQIKDYTLERNDDYYGEKPFVENITFKFFVNFEEAINALNSNSIQGLSYVPRNLKEGIVAKDSLSFHQLNLPQVTAVFFNQKTNAGLADKKVRQALTEAIDRNIIVTDVFADDARVINGPILPNSFAYQKDTVKYNFNKDEAITLLAEAGWKTKEVTADMINEATTNASSEDETIKAQANTLLSLGTGNWRSKDDKQYLIITLTTVDNEDAIRAAEKIKSFWENVGVKTLVEVIPSSLVQSEIIRPRNFEALLYGQIVGYDPDLYAFWHSSQAGEKGFNIANYANSEVDLLLEEARQTAATDVRIEKYKKFQDLIAEDIPAIFLYSPYYTYVQEKVIKDFNVQSILTPANRFANIQDWYVKTGKKLVF